MVSFKNVVKDVIQIVKEASLYGEDVQVLAHVEPEDNIIVVDFLKVPASLRRSGIGSHVLEEFKDLALGYNIPIRILPSSDFGTPPQVLNVFYMRNGFYRQGEMFWFNKQ